MLILIFLALILGIVFYIYKKKKSSTSSSTPTPNPNTLPAGLQRDSLGNIVDSSNNLVELDNSNNIINKFSLAKSDFGGRTTEKKIYTISYFFNSSNNGKKIIFYFRSGTLVGIDFDTSIILPTAESISQFKTLNLMLNSDNNTVYLQVKATNSVYIYITNYDPNSLNLQVVGSGFDKITNQMVNSFLVLDDGSPYKNLGTITDISRTMIIKNFIYPENIDKVIKIYYNNTTDYTPVGISIDKTIKIQNNQTAINLVSMNYSDTTNNIDINKIIRLIDVNGNGLEFVNYSNDGFLFPIINYSENTELPTQYFIEIKDTDNVNSTIIGKKSIVFRTLIIRDFLNDSNQNKQIIVYYQDNTRQKVIGLNIDNSINFDISNTPLNNYSQFIESNNYNVSSNIVDNFGFQKFNQSSSEIKFGSYGDSVYDFIIYKNNIPYTILLKNDKDYIGTKTNNSKILTINGGSNTDKSFTLYLDTLNNPVGMHFDTSIQLFSNINLSDYIYFKSEKGNYGYTITLSNRYVNNQPNYSSIYFLYIPNNLTFTFTLSPSNTTTTINVYEDEYVNGIRVVYKNSYKKINQSIVRDISFCVPACPVNLQQKTIVNMNNFRFTNIIPPTNRNGYRSTADVKEDYQVINTYPDDDAVTINNLMQGILLSNLTDDQKNSFGAFSKTNTTVGGNIDYCGGVFDASNNYYYDSSSDAYVKYINKKVFTNSECNQYTLGQLDSIKTCSSLLSPDFSANYLFSPGLVDTRTKDCFYKTKTIRLTKTNFDISYSDIILYTTDTNNNLVGYDNFTVSKVSKNIVNVILNDLQFLIIMRIKNSQTNANNNISLNGLVIELLDSNGNKYPNRSTFTIPASDSIPNIPLRYQSYRIYFPNPKIEQFNYPQIEQSSNFDCSLYSKDPERCLQSSLPEGGSILDNLLVNSRRCGIETNIAHFTDYQDINDIKNRLCAPYCATHDCSREYPDAPPRTQKTFSINISQNNFLPWNSHNYILASFNKSDVGITGNGQTIKITFTGFRSNIVNNTAYIQLFNTSPGGNFGPISPAIAYIPSDSGPFSTTLSVSDSWYSENWPMSVVLIFVQAFIPDNTARSISGNGTLTIKNF